jgi:hypothetical protein
MSILECKKDGELVAYLVRKSVANKSYHKRFSLRKHGVRAKELAEEFEKSVSATPKNSHNTSNVHGISVVIHDEIPYLLGKRIIKGVTHRFFYSLFKHTIQEALERAIREKNYPLHLTVEQVVTSLDVSKLQQHIAARAKVIRKPVEGV